MLKHMQKFLLLFEKHKLKLVLVILVLIPLYPKLPLFSVKGTFVAVRLEDLVIAFCLAIWALYLIFSGKILALIKEKIIQALLVFFFISFISTFSAIFLTQSATAHLAVLHFLRRVELMLLLPFVLTCVENKKNIKFLISVLLGVTLIVNLYALGQQYLNWPVISTTNSEFSKGQILTLNIPAARVNSTFAGHYDLAIFEVMILCLILSLFFYLKNIWSKILYLGLGSLSFIILIMTAARLSFVAAIFGIAASLVWAGQKKFVLALLLVVAVSLIYPSQLRDRFISTVTINLEKGGDRFTATTLQQEQRSKLNIPTLPSYNPKQKQEATKQATPSSAAADIAPGEPIDTTDLGVYRSLAIRFNVEWPKALNAFYKNPVLGTGYSSVGLAVDNDILRSLAEVGILGTLAFIILLIAIIKEIWKNLKNEDRFVRLLSAGVLAIILAFLINGLFIDVFEASKVATIFWIIIGLELVAGRTK